MLRAEADVAGAEARLAQAKKNAGRLKPLYADNAVSQKEYDDAASAESIGDAVDGEIEDRTTIRRQVPAEAYLRLQKRFAHLWKGGKPDTKRIEQIQATADRNIARFRLLGEPH